MTGCPWIRRSVAGLDRRGRILVPLHAHGADLDELVPLCRAAAPRAAICAPQGPRSLDPVFSSRPTGGGGRSRAPAGFAWFRCDPASPPARGGAGTAAVDPASFGDALWHLELLVDELHSEGFAGSVLLGRREGALLALAARPHLGTRLDGVVAIGCDAAAVPDWAVAGPDEPAAAPLLCLPDEAPATLDPPVGLWIGQLGPPRRSATPARGSDFERPPGRRSRRR